MKQQKQNKQDITDITIHYYVKKNKTDKTDIQNIIKTIYDYIQTNEIYFNYEPSFYGGILIFGIVGFQSDHDTFQKEVGELINGFGGRLSIHEIKTDKNVY